MFSISPQGVCGAIKRVYKWLRVKKGVKWLYSKLESIFWSLLISMLVPSSEVRWLAVRQGYPRSAINENSSVLSLLLLPSVVFIEVVFIKLF